MSSTEMEYTPSVDEYINAMCKAKGEYKRLPEEEMIKKICSLFRQAKKKPPHALNRAFPVIE